MAKKILIVFFALSMLSLNIFAEEEGISFKKEKPFVDHEFEELQRTYIRNRKIQLAALKKLPLNQYPEEFILKLINQIKHEVKGEVERDLLKYLQKIRKQIAEKKHQQPTPTYKKRKRKTYITPSYKFPKKRTQKKRIIRKPRKVITKKHEKQTKRSPHINGKNRILRFSLNNNTSFIGINALTKLPISATVTAASNIEYIDVQIFVKNITTQRHYLLKRFYAVLKGKNKKKSFAFLWEYPKIPLGKYKPYLLVRFYDKHRKVRATTSQFWGNSSSSKIYILFKN